VGVVRRRRPGGHPAREGRPFDRAKNVTPGDESDLPRRRRGANGHGGNGGGGGGPVFRPVTGDVPWRRYLVIAGIIVALVVALGLLGGVVNLVTDVMWYDALGRRDVFQTRLWAQIGLFVMGFLGLLAPALLSIWLARRV